MQAASTTADSPPAWIDSTGNEPIAVGRPSELTANQPVLPEEGWPARDRATRRLPFVFRRFGAAEWDGSHE
jgi:hypothetical protein